LKESVLTREQQKAIRGQNANRLLNGEIWNQLTRT